MSFNDDVPDERDGDADFGYDEQQFVTELLQVHAAVVHDAVVVANANAVANVVEVVWLDGDVIVAVIAVDADAVPVVVVVVAAAVVVVVVDEDDDAAAVVVEPREVLTVRH